MRQPLPPAERVARRRAATAKAQRKFRSRLAAAGAQQLTIVLSPEEATLFAFYADAQNGPLACFPKRALLMGAKFIANSGRPRGKKVKT